MEVTAETSQTREWPEPPHNAWEEWLSTGSSSSRDRLVEHYLPLARSVAARIYRGRPDQTIPFDDYLQYARIGLLESVARFDPTRGAPFTAYAMHRIRGAILNGLTRETEFTAQREAARRIRHDRRESLLSRLERGVDHATLEELIEVTMGLALGALLENAEDLADDSQGSNPYQAAEVQQLKHMTRDAVERLPARERDLIVAHYFQQREFCVIAGEWELSTGRISQLHASALMHLRQILASKPRLNRSV